MRIRHDSLISTLGNLSLAGSTTSTDSFSASGTSGTYRLGVAFGASLGHIQMKKENSSSEEE